MINTDFWDKTTIKQIADNGALHMSSVPNVRGNIDACTYISSEKFTMRGWLTDTAHGAITDIRIKGGKMKKHLFNFPRPDVAEFYKSPKVLNVGFSIDFTAPTTTNSVEVQVLLEKSKAWVTVFVSTLLPNRISITPTLSKVNDHIPGMIVVDNFIQIQTKLEKSH